MNRKTISVAASAGAVTWATYGIVEGAAIVYGVYVRPVLHALFPAQIGAPAVPLEVNTAFTAVVLALYPIFGALLNACFALFAPKKQSPSLWYGVSSLMLSLAFAAYALPNGRYFVLPIAAVVAALSFVRIAGGERWRMHASPLSIAFILVGGTIAAEVLHETPLPVRMAVPALYIVIVLAAAELVRRRRDSLRLVGRRWLAFAGGAAVVIIASAFIGGRALALPGSLPPRRATNDARPNVVLITLDSVRADHLSLYGYVRDTTPNLRRFASAATVYTSAISTSNHTLASHAAIFSGEPASKNGAHRFFRDVHLVVPHRIVAGSTMAEILSDQGYCTGGVVANTAYLLPIFGFDRGFDVYDWEVAHDFFTANADRPYLLRSMWRETLARLFAPMRSQALFVDAQDINRKAVKFVQTARGTGRPFFLFINYMDAHSPYVPPPPYDGLFPGRDDAFRWATYADLSEDVCWKHKPIPPRASQHLISQYDGGIAYIDSQMAALFDKLRAMDAFDNTLIIVTADHGEGFGAAGIVGHGLSLYQHQIHVPLVIKYPHQRTAATVTQPVSALDLLPTVLDAVGARLPIARRGINLADADLTAPRMIVSETYHPRRLGPNPDVGKPTEIAVLSGSMKEIFDSGRPTELFDLETDPHETTNLLGKRQFDPRFTADAAAFVAEARSSKPSEEIRDRELLERLRSLGYLR